MKVGVIGVGAVGTAIALALMQRGSTREIILVDRNRKRALPVATDMRYGSPLSPAVDIRDGSCRDLAGSELVMITVGIKEKTGGATDISLAQRFAVLRAGPTSVRATAGGETVRATADELGRPPRPAWQR